MEGIKDYLRFYDLVCGHSMLKLRQSSGLGGGGEGRSFLDRGHGWIKIVRKEKLVRVGLIGGDSLAGPQIDGELARAVDGI